jgi:hypothetical protein
MLLKYHTDCILSCSNASPIESPKRCPNALTKKPQRDGYLSLFSHLYFNLPKQFHAIGILPDPPFFPFVLKQRRRTGESLQCLPSAGASNSRCTFASCCTPLLCPSCCPLWLVVVLPLVMLPPPVRLRLCLSSHRRLSLRPSCASCPTDCCVNSCHTAAFHPSAPPPLIAPPPLTAPLLRLLSGWLSRHFLSRRCLPSACAFASHCTPLAPLVWLVVASPLATPPPPPVACASAFHCAAASHHAPLAPLFRLVVASPLVTPPPPVRLRLHLSLHRRFSLRPSVRHVLHTVT